MNEEELDQAYEAALEASRRRGAVTEFPPGEERRGDPRIRILADPEQTGLRTPNYMIDVSVSGAGICSREPARERDILHIFIGDEGPFRISVVDCRFSEFDHEAMITHYRLNCVADDESEGKRLLVHLMSQGDQELRLKRPQPA